MKKAHYLPFYEPQFVCYNHLMCANAIIKANVKEKLPILMTSKYINCYYKEDSINHKFVISIYDHWCTAQKIMQNQSVNLLKEVYQSQNIDMILMIKKMLCNNSYVFGQCNRIYIEPNSHEEDPPFNFVISGFDDSKRVFIIHGLDMMEHFLCVECDYLKFVNSLFDTFKPNIAFTLWHYNTDVLIDFDLPNIIFELEDYVDSGNRRNHYIYDKVYGIKAIEKLADHIRENAEHNNYFYLKKLLLHKTYMKERIECLIKYNFIECRWMKEAEDAEKNIQDALYKLSLFYDSQNFSLIDQISSLIIHTNEIEKNYLPIVLENLKFHLNKNES